MNEEIILELLRQTLTQAFLLAAPILAVTLIVGIGVSLFQTITTVQEMTLSFIPKVFMIGATLLLAGPWMLRQITGFVSMMLQRLPDFVK